MTLSIMVHRVVIPPHFRESFSNLSQSKYEGVLINP